MTLPEMSDPPADGAPTAGQYLGGLLVNLVGQVREGAELFLDDHHEEALHQLRISVRRLRAATTFLRPITWGEPAIRRANSRLRELALPFGEVRDLDVIGAAVASSSGQEPAEGPPAPVGGGVVDPADAHDLAKDMEDRRIGAAHQSEAVLSSRRWARELEAIEAAATSGAWRHAPAAQEEARHVVSHELDTWWWRLAARWQDLASLTPHRRHRVRIAAKKLRYLTELTADLYGEREGERASSSAAFKELQDHLGEIQDRVAGAALAEAYGFAALPPDPAADDAALARALAVVSKLESTPPYWRNG